MQHKALGFWIGAAIVLVASVLFARTTPKVAPTPASAATAAPANAALPASIALHADANGHFHIQAVVDGRSLTMVVDTGASLCAFSQEDAERLGLRLRPGDFSRNVSTANGTVRVAPVRIGVIQVGSITVRNVEAVVIQRGLLGTNLLGMSFLKRLRAFDMAGGRLILRG